MYSKNLTKLIVSLLLFGAFSSIVKAQTGDPINLTLSPTSIQFETNPQEIAISEIKIRNNGDKPEYLKVTVGKFKADESGEKPVLLDPSITDKSLEWISFDKNEVTIDPNEWETIKVTFSPPSDAALSYFYAIYFARNVPELSGNGTYVIGSPAVMALATVKSPNAIREIKLDKFSVKNAFLEFLPQGFETKIRNTGNVNVIPSGSIFIDGQGKKDLAVLAINPNASVVIPDSARTFTTNWDDGFPVSATENGTTTLKWDFDKATHLRIGRYTAHLILVYDNGERDVPIESTVSFWIFPTRLVLAAIAIPTLPALIIYLIMKRKMKRYAN